MEHSVEPVVRSIQEDDALVYRWLDPNLDVDIELSLGIGEFTTDEPIVGSGNNTPPQAHTWIAPVLTLTFGVNGRNLDDVRELDLLAKLQAAAVGAEEVPDLDSLYLPFRVGGEGDSRSFVVSHRFLRVRAPGLLHDKVLEVGKTMSAILKLTGTLSVVVRSPSRDFLGTIYSDRNVSRMPMFAIHPGYHRPERVIHIVRSSDRWEAAVPGRLSFATGAEDFPDDHYVTYASLKTGRFLPGKVVRIDACVMCSSAETSREHCSPNWLASMFGVEPVTASILCRECNGLLGRIFEERASVILRSGSRFEEVDGDFVAAWALKTSILLSLAANVRVPAQLLNWLGANEIPETVSVFYSERSTSVDGYQFTVTHFRQRLIQEGRFLVSLSFGNHSFVVVEGGPARWSDLPLTSDALQHRRLVEILTGTVQTYAPTQLGPVQH